MVFEACRCENIVFYEVFGLQRAQEEAKMAPCRAGARRGSLVFYAVFEAPRGRNLVFYVVLVPPRR